MNIRNIFLCVFGILLSSTTLVAQGIVNVNTLTGAANITIPIDQVSQGGISVPISLIYNGSGVKPKDVEYTAGMGWQLAVGGQITRQVRGLPDDSKKDKANFNISGWIYGSSQSSISGYTIQNNGSTCSNETTDLAFISSHFPHDIDSEPDMFYVNAPGLSCQLVWDQSLATPGFRTIPYKDYVITPTFNPTTGALTSISILNDNGITYVFGSPESVTESTEIASDATTVNFFKNTYDQYLNGIVYNNNWHLTSMIDPNGNGVTLAYTTAAKARGSQDPVILWSGGVSGAKTRIAQYTVKQSVLQQTLATISIIEDDDPVQIMTFSWTTSETGQSIINTITGKGKAYGFAYSPVSVSGGRYFRSFLRNFYDGGCGSPVNYKFTYAGESVDSNGSIWTTTLADSTSTNIDYWGYHNSSGSDLVPAVYVNPSNTAYPRYTIKNLATPGSAYTNSISGTDRSASAGTAAIDGSLISVSYAQGGSTTIVYEPNDYLDVPSGTTVKGGGIRVKQITDAAVNTSLSIVRNYSYKSSPYLSTSPSSGKPVSLPQFAFTTPYTGTATGNDYWSLSTIRSETDLSPEDHTIMYGSVRESKTGAGSTLYEFNIPATNWDNLASPTCNSCSTEWAPTIAYTGRTNCAVGYGSVVNGTNTYPFAPNPNYDFERGLPKKITNFNDDGIEVSETSFTYTRTSSSPVIIPAIAWDNNINAGLTATAYSKYNIYTSVGELTGTATKKVFDLPNLTTSQTSTTTYTYNTGQHKLIKEAVTNSDGSVIATNIQYVKDFTTSGSNADVVAIGNLKTKNINIPIETYQQVTRGAATVTTGASLTTFKAVTTNVGTSYLPSQQFKFFSANGDPSFTPYTIVSGTPNRYSGYPGTPTLNFAKYDEYGHPLTTDDGHLHVRTAITNFTANAPAAVFTNASADEVAFRDFDSFTSIGTLFSVSGTLVYTADSHTGQAITFTTSQTLSKAAITRNAWVKQFIFAIWMKAPSGSNSLTFTLTGGTTYTKNYAGTGAWKYYQFSIPVAGVSTGFTLSVTSSTTIAIDDVLFYPENAEVATFAYDPLTHLKSAQTNTNGISSYYNYDQWGRLIYTLDQDKNILQKNSFVLPSDVQNNSAPVISHGGNYVNLATTFAVFFSSCGEFGTLSAWDFGDGSTAPATIGQVSHTYAAIGTYTVTATATSPLFGTKTATATIVITNPPPPAPGNITLSYTNHSTGNGDITSVSFNDGVHTPTVVPVASLNGYLLPQGIYTIQVIFATGSSMYTGSSGYASLYISGNCWSQCHDFDIHNIYTDSNVNLSSCSTLNFSVNTVNCATLLQ